MVLIHWIQKKPQYFTKTLFFNLRQLIFVMPKNHTIIRSHLHLAKLVFTIDHFKKSFMQDFGKQNFSIFLKLFHIKLHFPFGTRKALGCLIAMPNLQTHELFLEHHLQQALNDIIPGIQIYKNSYFVFQDHQGLRFIYFELEQFSAKAFDLIQKRHLKTMLPQEIKAHIETLTHPLFVLRNDEEIVQNILKLSKELQEEKDIPQVIIRFENQEKELLNFLIILVRLKPSCAPSLKELLNKNADFNLKFEQTKIVGTIQDHIQKEANVFYIQIEKRPHLRKDHSIDLMSARSHLTVLLSSVIGDFRDLNGGMIIKQNELFALLKKELKDEKVDLFLLENFFYSLTPVAIQTTLLPFPLKTLFNLLQKRIQQNTDNLLVQFNTNYCAFALSASFETKELLDRHIEPLISQDLELAVTHIIYNNTPYFAYLYLSDNPSKQRLFSQTLKQTLEEAQRQIKVEKAIKLNIPEGITSLDPRLGQDPFAGLVKMMIYEGLMRLDETAKPKPAMCQSVDISKDYKIFIFYLRDCKWSNQDPVIAYDFECAWKKVLDPNFHALHAHVFYVIKNAKKANVGQCKLDDVGIYSIDEKTLKVELEHPAPYFLELVSNWTYFPINSRSDQTHPGWAFTGAETLITNGPFVLKEWSLNQKMNLAKNRHYWDKGNVFLEKISISFIQDPLILQKLWGKNAFDFLGYPLEYLTTNLIEANQNNKELHKYKSDSTTWLEFNIEQFPFQSQNIRQAFSLALNRKEICEKISKGPCIPAYEILPPSIQLNEKPCIVESKIQAQRLFKIGLKELNTTKEKISPVTITHPDSILWQKLALELKSAWQNTFDIEVKTESYGWSEFLKLITNNLFQIAGSVWYSWYSDPIYTLDLFKYKDRKLNCSQWEDPKYSNLLDKAENESDPKKRLLLLKQAEELVIKKAPLIPIWHVNEFYLQKSYLKNVLMTSSGSVDFKCAKIEENI
ncbi:MAG: Oligopeptide-binding protein OppA [Chlamydiae bacterium]|nr:Oligopeptide-binding protein OppA [Chlamydiota bacterium]